MFTKINLIGYGIMVALIGWLWFQNHSDDQKISELTIAVTGLEAKVKHHEDLKALKDDITLIFGNYAKVYEENSKTFNEQQNKLIELSTKVSNDVEDYAKNPATSSNVIDGTWVRTYNRSAVRLQ
jgi:hypothetical protein